ncbi:MAG TPA: exodeoxyribonuclease V subunit alpha, partial [Acidimicrobiales bacterium]
TGKTTTVARVVALLDEQAAAAGEPAPKIALAAPTGKAAARLQEGVRREADRLDVSAATRQRLARLSASTIHRLLGTRPDSQSRFRHDRTNRLPYDAVIIDETSMVALSLMARVVEALRPDARLVLLGDPDQLSSVEAGAVLGDIVGPAADELRMTSAARAVATRATGQAIPADAATSDVGDGIVVLRQVFRFGGGIAQLAAAIRAGDADATLAALRAHPDAITWSEVGDEALDPLRRAVVDAGVAVTASARAGDGRGALDALGTVRILCAHRRGPQSVASWTARAEGWLAAAIDGYGTGGRWYLGRPLLVTHNDYSLNLSNGDVGVVVDIGSHRVAAAFERAGEIALVAPTRLEAVETVHAMTIHKSQGSQFDTVAVVLPDAESRLATRELLYTAVTRARRHVHIIGDEAAIRAALGRRLARASGLRRRLWDQ